MKEIKTFTALARHIYSTLLPALLLMLLLLPVQLLAQTDSTKTADSTAPEAPSLIAPSIDLITVQKADNTIDLKAAIKAKVKGTYIKLPLLKISFVQITDTAEKALGFLITDRNGAAVLNITADGIKTDTGGKLLFKALFAGNKAMETAEGEVTIKRARLEMVPVKGDSVNSVQIKLIDIGTGEEKPVPEIAVGIFVKREFNPLKIGEGTTDESGEASVDIPNNLPGDDKGNITLLAKLDENEIYGNLEVAAVQKWGVPVSNKIEQLPRALWSSHPPLWMLITFVLLMAVVWGHYIVIIVQLFRLRNEEPHATAN
jgi:hypothetical protein